MINNLYYDADDAPSFGLEIDDSLLASALAAIYNRDYNPDGEIDPSLFVGAVGRHDAAIDKAFIDDPAERALYNALKNSADVFAAFKVHKAQNDMAAKLLDSNGALKPFDRWLNDVLPIASHQFGPWLRTEYDTAVIRAQQAAEWKRFERDKDVLPNLKWMPSTSPNPGADHRVYWGTILPVDHPFWSRHRPGDRWNCQCSLESTDEPATGIKHEDAVDPQKNGPQKGLKDNPGKTGQLFGNDHPYYTKAYKGARKAAEKLLQRIAEMKKELPDTLSELEKTAIAGNNIEIEKKLKITKGKPMSIGDADKQSANPHYVPRFVLDPKGTYKDSQGRRYSLNKAYDKDKHHPYTVNCQTCAPAFVIRIRGFKITAKPKTTGSKSEHLSHGYNVWEVWKNPDGSAAKHDSITDWMTKKGYKRMSKERYKEFFDESCKEEGIYELSIGWKGGGGHATILWRFKDGTLKYIEPQADNSEGSGYEFKDTDYIASNGEASPHGCRGIMRVDNKLFNTDYVDIFEK